MRVAVPTSVKELNLDQLIALVQIILLTRIQKDSEEGINDAQAQAFEHAMAKLLNISVFAYRMLTADTVDTKVMPPIGNQLVPSFTANINLIMAQTKLSKEYFYLESPPPRKWYKLLLYRLRKLLRLPKYDSYFMGDPGKQPTFFWTNILDGVMKRVAKLDTDNFMKVVFEIPYVLAATAWPRGLSALTVDSKGEYVIDHALFAEKRERIKQLPALDALTCMRFFLSKMNYSGRAVNIVRSAKRPHTKTTSPQKSEKLT